MVRAWYLDTTTDDIHAENKGDCPRYLTKEEIFQKTRVEFFDIDITTIDEPDSFYQNLRKERGYNYEDFIEVDREKLKNYDELVEKFAREHIHADDEVRLCIDGSAYFDVKDGEDKWIRIDFYPGNLIVLPAGICHCLSIKTGVNISARRLFSGDPVWTAIYQPVDQHPARQSYLKMMASVQN